MDSTAFEDFGKMFGLEFLGRFGGATSGHCGRDGAVGELQRSAAQIARQDLITKAVMDKHNLTFNFCRERMFLLFDDL
jgi:hypothetical protein